MDHPSPLLVLLQTIDRVLSGHGTDPAVVTEEDKILLAAQYVESGALREMMNPPTAVEVSRLGAVLNPASRQS